MGHLRVLAVRLAFMTLCATGACGDENAPPGVPDGEEEDADSPDGPEHDAGEDEDGSVAPPDAAGMETGPLADGATELDAGDISECAGDMLEFSAARALGRPLTAAIAGNQVHLVYVVPSGGGTSSLNTAQGLRYVPFATTGDVGMGTDIVNVGINLYNRTRDPALVSHDNKLELFFTSNTNGPYDLFYKDLGTATAPVQETMGSSPARNEYALAAGSFGDAAAVVYSNEPITVGMPGALTLKLPGQTATELVADSVGYHAAQVAFSEIGITGARRGVAAFLSDLAAKPGLFAIPVGADGGPNGALVTLSTAAGGASSIDVVRGKDGRGGLIYTEAPAGGAHQLRFRVINDDGTISTTVKNLTSGNQDLRDISIAPYSFGYVIAYRRVGGLPGVAASIYLMFVDVEGNRSGTRLVRSTSLSGGGLKVLVANDGRLVVLWADTESVTNPTTMAAETALKVRAARLTCVL